MPIENPPCNDAVDNDGDGLIDFPNDPQCHAAHDWDEFANTPCDDGVDNDGDGKIDWPSDAGCSWFLDGTEDTTPAATASTMTATA
jgi:endoglucanase